MSEAAPSIAWSRVATGLNLAGIGFFLLLTTRGNLSWSFWAEAVTFWPVLLIAWGLRVLFDRTRYPWVVLFSPIIVLGTLGFLAWRGPDVTPSSWAELSAERPAETQRWTLSSQIAFAELDVEGRAMGEARLAEGRMSPASGGYLSVSERGGRVLVRARRERFGRGHVVFLPRHHQHWELGVSQQLPMRIDLDLAAVEGRVRVAGTPVERVDIDGAFNRLTLELGAPAEDVRLDLGGAFNDFELIVPRDTGVRVSTDGPLNVVDRRSEQPGGDGPRYLVRLNGLCNRIVVSSP